MKKLTIIFFGALFVLLLGWPSAILSLLVTGHIPGTTLTIPFWAMIVVYCLLITMIITLYVEDALSFALNTKAVKARKSRMPHRRFGQI